MNRYYSQTVLLPFALILAACFSACSSSIELQSNWIGTGIIIDGYSKDWSNYMKPIQDKKVNLGFNNDNEYLYLCLTTEDKAAINQIVRSGLIVWLKSEKGERKEFGIQYPMKGMPAEFEDRPFNPQNESSEAQPDDRNKPGKMNEMLAAELQKQTEFRILNEDKFPLTAMQLMNDDGIELKMGMDKDLFVYEIKIPLLNDNDYPFIVGAVPGDKVEIKFESEEPEMKRMQGDGKGDRMPPSGGGKPGRAGMPQGGRGGGGRPSGQGQPEMNKEVKIDFSVLLTLSKN